MVLSCLCGTENFLRYSAPIRTGRQGITLDILLCHDGDRSWMPLFDRGNALHAQALLYVLGSHSQLFLRRIGAPPFEDSLGCNVVVLVHRQDVYMGVRHIEARGKHPDLPRLISDCEYWSHPSDHQHQRNKRVLIQFIE